MIQVLTILPITAAILFIIIAISQIAVFKLTDIKKAELQITENRLMHELSAEDSDSRRTLAGVIDEKMLEPGKMDEAINFGTEMRIAGSIKTDNHEIAYNKKWYTVLNPQAGIKAQKTKAKVYVIDNGQAKPATIEVLT